jgi:putative tryptophan/tyrosine transport system substrate-binding protein
VAMSGADALYVQPDAITFPKFGEIAAFALKRRLVTIGLAPQFVNAGGLLHCGPDVQELLARTVSYVDRILRGARPAELPVEMPTHFVLAINLKTAKALGITIPQSLLLRADEVIE